MSGDHAPSEAEKFSLTWDALKLLGKNLYSHPWSAISELVANGIDANAREVYVHLDMSKGKEHARLEILDNGVGMDETGLLRYVKVGYKKRNDADDRHVKRPMGRKGIGKLAALYLSNVFYLLTKQADSNSLVRKVDVANASDDEQPQLLNVSLRDVPDTELRKKWEDNPSGTLILIEDINLKGYGEKAFEALEEKLANQFLVSSLTDCAILYKNTKTQGHTGDYKQVEKHVAYGNLLSVRTRFTPDHPKPDEWDKNVEPGRNVKVQIRRETVELPVKISTLAATGDEKRPGTAPEGQINVDGEVVDYSLAGWIGMHASIDNKVAKQNDENYNRNNFHSPSEIRLYVRNKLAIANVVPLLGLTQTYVNYIEGEISFDVLDEDRLDDIATTSREGFDEGDKRMDLLKKILREQVRALIDERNKLNDKSDEVQESARKQVVEDLGKELRSKGIDEGIVAEVQRSTAQKIKKTGAEAKSEYQVFLSHARANRCFTDLIDELLREKGVKEEEIFYTSRQAENIPSTPNLEPLERQIRDSITRVNTRIAYVTSQEFTKSTYCLFEAGAGWAMRGVKDYDIFPDTYKSCPEYLHHGQRLEGFADDKTHQFIIGRGTYISILEKTNNLIEHLNKGRRHRREAELETYKIEDIPSDNELAKRRQTVRDYMDPEILAKLTTLEERWAKEVIEHRSVAKKKSENK
ncbi:ATP-binding protein [Actinotignum sp. GS-2025c]|uniref:ATP-binding protein n=1 Tax=Actinotignum sp. GS-2025c TaxID=3427276 RepID=UPI003F480782